jgi:C-terminal processing protease CtpA/Prc
MRRIGIISLVGGLLAVFAEQPNLRAEAKSDALDFKEVYDSIREHLAGTTDAELNRAAVKGLLTNLAPKVSLVESSATTNSGSHALLLSKVSLYDGNIAYLRIGRVEDGLARAVRDGWEKLGATNKLKGVVLDLRFAGGDNYAVAAATADLFAKKEQPLLDWGDGVVRSKRKRDSIDLPVAVVVNRETSGAAEALAALFRETGCGLILGARTAGQAMITKDFPLKNGERLRIATAPVRLGDGSALPAAGVKPDIAVEVSPEQERTYYADAFASTANPDLAADANLSLTNPPAGANRNGRRARFNEAELVRERREGIGLDGDLSSGREAEAERPVVRDPALARALDLLKGLAVVRQSRS